MPIILREQEVRREVLSGSTGGGAIRIDADLDSAADVTVLHHVGADDAIDSVWIQIWNDDANEVDVYVSLNPASTTGASDIEDAATRITIPSRDSYWVLQGDAFRKRGSNTWTVAAYVATADAGKLRATGYIIRAGAESLY